MLDYAEQVNIERAIPDAATGLKPIHRKILYEMWKDKVNSKSKYRKCAYMVGQIIARFSEHGDTGTYDALVRLSKDWVHNHPLIDFHGNNGSIYDPSSYAAMRYTEGKLSKIAELGYLEGLDRDTVDWIPNFTNEEMEPTSLPARFPGLFCLSTEGIGYGCACAFFSMNLTEVCNGLIDMLQGNISTFPVLQYDLPTGGTIINPHEMRKVYETGRGTIKLMSTYQVINDNKLVVTEIPYGVSVTKLVDSLQQDDRVKSVADESGAGILRLKVTLYPNSIVDIDNFVLHSDLTVNCNVNQVALVDNKPKQVTQQDMAQIYLQHNLTCKLREIEFLRQRTATRLEVLAGYLIAFNNTEKIVRVIKTDSFVPGFLGLTESQVRAIMDLQMKRLTKLSHQDIQKEYDQLSILLQEYDQLIADSHTTDKRLLKQEVIKNLIELRDLFGKDRKTKIQEIAVTSSPHQTTVNRKDEINVTFKKMFLRETGTIIDSKERGKESFLNLFSNKGKQFVLKVNKDLRSSFVKIGDVISLDNDESIIAAYSNEALDGQDLVFVSKNGYIKSVFGSNFISTTRSIKGKAAISIRLGDEIMEVLIEGDTLTIQDTDKKEVVFQRKEVPIMGKNSAGKRLIRNKQIVSATVD